MMNKRGRKEEEGIGKITYLSFLLLHSTVNIEISLFEFLKREMVPKNITRLKLTRSNYNLYSEIQVLRTHTI